jgi:phage baseplate assembly protein W
MAKTGLYKGFSSFEFERTKSFKLNDIELVKLDLLNHIFTRRGERVMMPTFGTMIPDMIFEPLDGSTLSTIDDELRMVFNYDPRVELMNLTIVPNYDQNSIVASATLLYVELDMIDNLELNIQFEE